MNPIKHEHNSPLTISDFIQSFGNWQKDQTIILDPSTGSGNIQIINIEKGLQFCIWDCTFARDIEILHEKQSKTNKTFTLAYYLTPGSFNTDSSTITDSKVFDTILISNDVEFKAHLLPGSEIRCISLNFSADWIQENILCDISTQGYLLEQFSNTAKLLSIVESLTSLERRVADSFFEKDKPELSGKFFLRSKVLNLLTAFFSKISGRLLPTTRVDKYHGDQIAEVEKQLTENLYKGLPDIKKLAKKVAISESTLKRYFRMVYGKNIYTYYLEKRMACAKTLLLERQKTVSETACIMGYENVSHFSNTFKRFFGTLPGTLKNKTNTQ